MKDQERIAVFIDGANLYATTKTLGFDIDYKRLLKEFQSRGYLLRAFYYTALIEDQEYSSIRPLIDWLDYNGYRVVTKPTKEFVDSTGRRKVKGNMDIELAIDAIELAPHVDHIVLFSGDGDFRSLVEALQRRGVRVSVVSTISTQPPMVADELRRQADEFIDLAHLLPKIGRDPADRPVRDHADRPPRFQGSQGPGPQQGGGPGLERRYGIRQGQGPIGVGQNRVDDEDEYED
ncbi:MAG: NYN domain-containing protein [Salinarimonas sp.]